MNTTENNKITAEFMGYKEYNHGSYKTFSKDDKSHYFDSTLQYDSDWNWLMPVIEKIESLGYKFQICRHRAQIYLDDGFNSPALCDSKSETKIQAAYAAVADFIKNYKS